MFRFIPLCLVLLVAAGSLAAQAPATNTVATNVRGIESRYEAANEVWRINVMLYILKDQTAKYDETIKVMGDFTSVSRSYVIFKRKGASEAEEIYFRNLENIGRMEQLKQLLEGYKKDFTGYNRDFMGTYRLEERDFADYPSFETGYQRILDRWRGEFEAAMKDKKLDEVRRIRQDMQIFRVAITAFTLFPGKSADMVGRMQKMENDVRHAIVMLRMYETGSP